MQTMEMKIAAQSHPAKVGRAIVHVLQEGNTVILTGIGAGAVNVMTKALIIAQQQFDSTPIQYRPAFTTVEVADRGKVVAIQWTIQTMA